MLPLLTTIQLLPMQILTGNRRLSLFVDRTLFCMITISKTRPKPPFGRQSLAGSWGKDTVRQVHFKVFSTSHFAPRKRRGIIKQKIEQGVCHHIWLYTIISIITILIRHNRACLQHNVGVYLLTVLGVYTFLIICVFFKEMR